MGSAAAADPLEGQVPLDPPGGGYDLLGENFDRSKLGSLGGFRAWDLQKKFLAPNQYWVGVSGPETFKIEFLVKNDVE